MPEALIINYGIKNIVPKQILVRLGAIDVYKRQFIRDAAAANPALWKMMVNGDAATLSSAASRSVGSVNGISVPTTKIVPR